MDETCREYERVVDEKYLDQIRAEAMQFSISINILCRGWIVTSRNQHVHRRQFLISKKYSLPTNPRDRCDLTRNKN